MTEESTVIEKIDNKIIGKLDLIELVCEKGNFTKSESTRAIECVLSIIKDSVKNEKEVQIRKFGSFIPAIQKAFTGRNPSTGESIEVAEKKTLRFKPSKLFKKYINDEVSDNDNDDEDEDELVEDE